MTEIIILESSLGRWDILYYRVFQVLTTYLFNRVTEEIFVRDYRGIYRKATEKDENDLARIEGRA